MIGILKIFFYAKGTNPWTVLTALLFSGLAGGLGMAGLLPLVTVAMDEGAMHDSPLVTKVFEVLETIGVGRELPPLLLLLVVATVLRSLLTLVAMRHVGQSLATVATEIRVRLIRHLLNVRWSYFTKQRLGRLANAISVDATRSGKAYMMAASFISNAIQATIYSVIAFFVSWKLSLVALGISALIALSLHFLVRRARQAGRRQTVRTQELVTYFADVLNSIKPLKAMNKQASFLALFERKISSLRSALRRQIITQETRRALQEILMVVSIALAFYMAIVVWSQALPEVLVMGVLMQQTIKSIGRVQENFQRAVIVESPYNAMQDLIAEAKAAGERPGGGQIPTLTRDCRLEGVDFAHEGHAVLKRASMVIPVNSLTVLTGPSGAGKTTISDLLLDLHQPDSGRVLIDGVDLGTLDARLWRSMIGYVPQEVILFHDTILANITLGDTSIGEDDIRAILELVGAWPFVSALPEGLLSTVGEKGAKLSGGQRQRIALARALAAKPELLILDEVTSALDPESERDISARIRGLAHEMTILAISHQPALLDVADQIYRLENGIISTVQTPLPAAARTA